MPEPDSRQKITPGADDEGRGLSLGKPAALALGPLVAGAMLALGPPAGLSAPAWSTAAVAVLMVLWWITEALPVGITALVPIAVLPLLGVAPIGKATAPYADPLIFLFLGGFVLARAVERWGLHRRVALAIVGLVGRRPAHIAGGFMIATAALSMWISNTATAVMMLPIGLSIVALMHPGSIGEPLDRRTQNFERALLLGIAYGASIGGVATLIGTPPNALMAAWLRESAGIDLGFGRWMAVGLPMSAILLAAAWFLLTRIVFPVGREPIAGSDTILAHARAELGPMQPSEKRVLVVFALVALAWITRPLLTALVGDLPLTDAGIAIIGAILLFAVPAARADDEAPETATWTPLLTWEDAKALPWSVLLLIGGGLSLADAIGRSGLAQWIGAGLEACTGWPGWVTLAAVAALILLLTEVMSNTATAAIFLPIVATLAACAPGGKPILAATVAMAASCAFMMPIATPSNAIVFASGRVRMAHMASAGILLNVIAVGLVTLIAWLWAPAILPAGH
jgi:sodium-dependent dicarboxylate transporter 2/3/5